MRGTSLRQAFWPGSLATIAATLAVLLYFGVTKALGEKYLLPLDNSGSRFEAMPFIAPILATFISGLLATSFFGLLIRFTRRPATIFLSVSITALILSLGAPFNLPRTGIQTKILLSGMHVIAAGLITAGILLSSRQRVKSP